MSKDEKNDNETIKITGRLSCNYKYIAGYMYSGSWFSLPKHT